MTWTLRPHGMHPPQGGEIQMLVQSVLIATVASHCMLCSRPFDPIVARLEQLVVHPLVFSSRFLISQPGSHMIKRLLLHTPENGEDNLLRRWCR